MLAMPAMLCLPAASVVATEKGPAAVPTVKMEAAEKERVDVGDGKDAAAKAPTGTVVAWPRLPAVMTATPNRRWWYLRGEMPQVWQEGPLEDRLHGEAM